MSEKLQVGDSFQCMQGPMRYTVTKIDRLHITAGVSGQVLWKWYRDGRYSSDPDNKGARIDFSSIWRGNREEFAVDGVAVDGEQSADETGESGLLTWEAAE